MDEYKHNISNIRKKFDKIKYTISSLKKVSLSSLLYKYNLNIL